MEETHPPENQTREGFAGSESCFAQPICVGPTPGRRHWVWEHLTEKHAQDTSGYSEKDIQ